VSQKKYSAKEAALVKLNEIKEFFFKAMLHGWVSGAKPQPVDGLPRFVGYDFTDGKFRLVDVYSKVPFLSTASAGSTIIWLDDTPVWTMTYAGNYVKAAIPILKEVLRQTYQLRMFCGGRGRTIANADWAYMNDPFPNDFRSFAGTEKISIDKAPGLLGTHQYSGLSLVKMS
jgi:hypothetical protein